MDDVLSTLTMSEPEDECSGYKFTHPGSGDILLIVCISLTLGVVSFFVFCFWRPRWKTLYSARKRRLEAAANLDLPQLPDSFFGWIPALYKVTEEQVLEQAGLDAYVVRLTALSFMVCLLLTWLGRG